MRFIPQLHHPRPKLSRIEISQEEITADLLYPARPRRPGGRARVDRRTGRRR
jgi:hypothetical protein